MKRSIFAVVLLFAMAGATSAQTPAPAPSSAAEEVKTVSPARAADMALAAGRQPSSLDPRVCLEFPTAAQVIACAEKYRPRKRPA